MRTHVVLCIGLGLAALGCQPPSAGPVSTKPAEEDVLDIGSGIELTFRWEFENNKEVYRLKNTVGDLVNCRLTFSARRQGGGAVAKEYVWGSWKANEEKEVDADDLESSGGGPLDRPFAPQVGWKGKWHNHGKGMTTDHSLSGTAKMNGEKVRFKGSFGAYTTHHRLTPGSGEIKSDGTVSMVPVVNDTGHDLKEVEVQFFAIRRGSGKFYYSAAQKSPLWKSGETQSWALGSDDYSEYQLFGFARQVTTADAGGLRLPKEEKVRLLTDWEFKRK